MLYSVLIIVCTLWAVKHTVLSSIANFASALGSIYGWKCWICHYYLDRACLSFPACRCSSYLGATETCMGNSTSTGGAVVKAQPSVYGLLTQSKPHRLRLKARPSRSSGTLHVSSTVRGRTTLRSADGLFGIRAFAAASHTHPSHPSHPAHPRLIRACASPQAARGHQKHIVVARYPCPEYQIVLIRILSGV